MVLGYWDTQGYDVLPTVDYAMFQSVVMNEAISSAEHWADYALPMDRYGEIQPDRSEKPDGDEHQNNSIADCLGTSQSRFNLRYSWTWVSRVPVCLREYSNTDTLTGHVSQCEANCWDFFVNEIGAGHPVVMTIKTGGGWHSVTGVGYDGGYYGVLDTWGDDMIWYPFSDCGQAVWCVAEVVSLKIESSQPVEPMEPYKVFLPVVEK
jgi:hypothetical protein